MIDRIFIPPSRIHWIDRSKVVVAFERQINPVGSGRGGFDSIERSTA
jgi:hypothetical protein